MRTLGRWLGLGPLFFAQEGEGEDGGEGDGGAGGSASGKAGGDGGKAGGAGGAGDGGKAGDGKGGAAGDGGAAGGSGDAGKTYTQSELDAMLAESRQQAAKARTDLKAAQDRAKAAADAQLSEDEKKAQALKDREADLVKREAAAKSRSTTAAIQEAVAGAGAPGGKIVLLARLIDREEVEYDDAGEPTNIATLVTKLKKDNPDLFAAPAGGGAGGSADGGSRGSGAALTKEQIKKMTPAEINARWSEVSKVLAGS